MTERNNKSLRNGRAQKEGSQQNLSPAVVETPAVVAELQQNGSVNNETPVRRYRGKCQFFNTWYI